MTGLDVALEALTDRYLDKEILKKTKNKIRTVERRDNDKRNNVSDTMQCDLVYDCSIIGFLTTLK